MARMPADAAGNYWRESSNSKVPNTKKCLQIKIFNIEISLDFGIWRLGFVHLNALVPGLISIIRGQVELQNVG
jgi:hypothetical protein